MKHYSLAKCAFFNNYYIGYETNTEYFTMKSTEKLNPFAFEEDLAGQSNTFVETFTVWIGVSIFSVFTQANTLLDNRATNK